MLVDQPAIIVFALSVACVLLEINGLNPQNYFPDVLYS